LGDSGAQSLGRLKVERGYRYRYSMTNFIELASHLADPPSEQTPNPFAKYRAAFRRLHTVFSGPLPSPESTLMHGVGLPQHMSPKWSVDDASVRSQVQIIAEAESLEAVRKAGIDPSHYKKLREIDAKSFLGLVAQARRDIRDPRIDLEAGGKLLHRFLGYLIFRASSEAVVLHQLPSDQQIAAIHFFERAGGRMFLAHFIKLLQRMI
jgi:hypothetical protein